MPIPDLAAHIRLPEIQERRRRAALDMAIASARVPDQYRLVGTGIAMMLGPMDFAAQLGIGAAPSEEEIRSVEDFYRSPHRPYSRVYVSELADPALVTLLNRRGYSPSPWTHRVWCFDLDVAIA